MLAVPTMTVLWLIEAWSLRVRIVLMHMMTGEHPDEPNSALVFSLLIFPIIL